MQPHHDVSPFARSFARTAVSHEGRQFMQRLAGRSVERADAVREAPQAAEGDWPDLDQRVRNVGEW